MEGSDHEVLTDHCVREGEGMGEMGEVNGGM